MLFYFIKSWPISLGNHFAALSSLHVSGRNSYIHSLAEITQGGSEGIIFKEFSQCIQF